MFTDGAQSIRNDENMQADCARTRALFALSRLVFVEINAAVDKAEVIHDCAAGDLSRLVGTYRIIDFTPTRKCGSLPRGTPTSLTKRPLRLKYVTTSRRVALEAYAR
jgi:hypothetical protein